jgi:hypothetical protein
MCSGTSSHKFCGNFVATKLWLIEFSGYKPHKFGKRHDLLLLWLLIVPIYVLAPPTVS